MRSVFFLSLMNSDAWGGSEEIWFHAAIRLARQGYKVGVCCFNWPGKEKKMKQLAEAGCTLYLLAGRQETGSFLGKIKLEIAVRKLPIEKYDDVVISQGGWKDIVHGPLKKIYSRCNRYSIIYHNYDRERLSSSKLKLFHQWTANAQVNIGAAAKVFSVIVEMNSMVIPHQKILYNPITFASPAGYTPVGDETGDALRMIVLAQLDVKRKAQDVLINTLATEKWKTRNWKLHLYGKGKDADYITDLVNKHQLQDKVFLKGYSNNVPEAIKWSHLLFHVTHIDAMPISVTEAMAMSRAVIVSDVGDMPLWVEDDKNGWIASVVTEKAIGEVLEKAWQNREKLEAMGKVSYDIFKNKYPEDPIQYFLDLAGIPGEKKEA